MFTRHGDKGDVMVTIHVDDMAVAASNPEALSLMVSDLCKVIDVVDMGPMGWFLS